MASPTRALPRLGFLGVGWIGRHRMRAIVDAGVAEAAMVADTDPDAAAQAAREVGADVVAPDDLLISGDLDGVVIATPSALHAQQTLTALAAGLAVFCQKPLGRDAAETGDVVRAASDAGLLLGVDLSYRHLAATEAMRKLLAEGAVGDLYAAELRFHNAYGPDKAWFRDRALSGGGCVIDLGTHLIDLVHWMLPGQGLQLVAAQLHAGGRRLAAGDPAVEDHASVLLETDRGASVDLACSWYLHAGRDAVIGASFHGTRGSVEVHNVDGSFYDFEAWWCHGTARERIAAPPDDWGGRAAVAWATRLASGDGAIEPMEAHDLMAVAAVIDQVYGR
jgi:predicted dehydrogenase